MRMRTGTAWSVLVATVAACAVLSLAAAILSGGMVRALFAACAVLFALSAGLIAATRRRYLELLDAASVIDCLKLKRPGILPREDAEAIVPKGKMPEE